MPILWFIARCIFLPPLLVGVGLVLLICEPVLWVMGRSER